MDNKKCSKCKEIKQVTEFYKANKEKCGLQSCCKSCSNLANKNSVIKNKERYDQYHKDWYLLNKSRILSNSKLWYENNRDKKLISSRQWYEENKGRKLQTSEEWRKANPEKVKQAGSNWRRNNIFKSRRYGQDKRARKIRATPSWANKEYITIFYQIAIEEEKRISEKCHVDHIVPLKSDLVCGLHCEYNLQVLKYSENIKKGNRYWPDMPDDPEEVRKFYGLK